MNADIQATPETPSLILSFLSRPFQNITGFDGQVSCGLNSWNMLDIEPPLGQDHEPSVHLSNLKPWTQYAIFVKAFTLTEDRSHDAKSDIVYIRTQASGKAPFVLPLLWDVVNVCFFVSLFVFQFALI